MGDSNQAIGRGFQPDSDVDITIEDQQKINQFAQQYAKHDEVRAELKLKENKLQDLEDAAEELNLMDDSDGAIPFLKGEIFMCLDINDANRALDKEKKKIQSEIRDLEEASEELKNVLSNLKTQLYAKFGNHINLEDS